jgi:hypothetical protein
MIVDQNNQNMVEDDMVEDDMVEDDMVEDDMVIDQNSQIIYNNQMVVDAFGNVGKISHE